MSKKLLRIFHSKKKNQDMMFIPNNIQSHFEQKDDDSTPLLLIGFTDRIGNKRMVIALDPNTASDLVEEVKKSPMKMFIKENKEEKDMMYA